MRRFFVYLTAAALVVGCKSAAKRGDEHGCEDGTLIGMEDATLHRSACTVPESVPVGCNASSGGTFRRNKYKDAYRSAYQQCYQLAYEPIWNVALYNEECDGTLDTGTEDYFDD